jgi:hypothetical protein
MPYPIPYSDPSIRKPAIKLFLGIGGLKFIALNKVVVATTCDVTLLQSSLARIAGISIVRNRPTGVAQEYSLNGKDYPVHLAKVPLRLHEKGGRFIGWTATVGFWDAPTTINYLGLTEALEYLDPKIVVPDREIVVEPNRLFHGRVFP